MNLLLLTVSLLLAALILKAMCKSPLIRFFGDKPDHRKVHQAIVPRFGGIGMILAFLAMLGVRPLLPDGFWPGLPGNLTHALVFISLFLLIAGGYDDAKPMGFKPKFVLQFTLATGIVYLLKCDFNTFAIFGVSFSLGMVGPLLSIFWLVALMNAVNLIDGIDGLAAGVAFIAFGAIAMMANHNNYPALVPLCVVMMGVILGFLRYNFSRSQKVFLGDAGSQFLGALLGLLSIEVQGIPKMGFSFFVPLFIVGYPLLDVSVTMIRRFRCGRMRNGWRARFMRMFMADNEHLHHRLVYLGLSHLQSSFLLVMVASGIGATAIIIHRVGWPYRPMAMLYLACALLLILNRLGYLGVRPWLTFPRQSVLPERIVGVIEPDEVFLHSLKSFKQDKFEFLSIPGKLTQFMTDGFVAVLLYNSSSSTFDEEWTKALRVTEIQDCPAVIIAEAKDIERVTALQPSGFRSVHFIEKPVRIPDLVRVLECIAQPALPPSRQARSFSLAKAALRSRINA